LNSIPSRLASHFFNATLLLAAEKGFGIDFIEVSLLISRLENTKPLTKTSGKIRV
jgi:hypothetical protein